MFNRIVVPLDGTALAEHALPFAEEMCSLIGSPIHLIRVVEAIPGGATLYSTMVDGSAYAIAAQSDREEADLYLNGIATDLTARGYHPTFEVRVGAPTDEVVGAVQSTDLLVIASHGRAGLPRLMLGSVAEDVLRHSPAPVLLVHTGHAAPERKTIAPANASAA
jgi:nucleotide-binding universal stress UspA family protein